MNVEVNQGILLTEFIRTPTKMAPRTGNTRTAAARAAQKVNVRGKKLADNFDEGPPAKPRPKPKKTHLRPTTQHSATPEVAISQRTVIDVNADSEDEIEPETGGGPDGVEGGGHDFGNGNSDGNGGHGDINGNDSDTGRHSSDRSDNNGGDDYDDYGGGDYNDHAELGGHRSELAMHGQHIQHSKHCDLICNHKVLTINQKTATPSTKTMRTKRTIAAYLFLLTSLLGASTTP
jgi:hypothetical protein